MQKTREKLQDATKQVEIYKAEAKYESKLADYEHTKFLIALWVAIIEGIIIWLLVL